MIFKLMDFVVPEKKIEENKCGKNPDKYLDHARELKEFQTIIAGTLESVARNLQKSLVR